VGFEEGQSPHVFSKCVENPWPVACKGRCGAEDCGVRAKGGATWILQGGDIVREAGIERGGNDSTRFQMP
jgi:hypothetical protein